MPIHARPQILGGSPVFSTPLAMAVPRLPDPRALAPVFEEIVASGQLTKGKHLNLFETASRNYLEVEQCVGVSSCTSGLMLVLQALKRRLPEGEVHRVAVPSFTFLASITAIMWAGFEPVFVECDPRTMLIDLQDLGKVLQDQPIAAVLAVHCFGNPVPAKPLEHLCAQHNARLVYDAAHGFGSIHEGVKVGRSGWCQVYSLTPTKMVVAGEGGLIATCDPELADELRTGREYGNDGSYDTVFPGLNARMSELHAALANASLLLLEEVIAHRHSVAQKLYQALSGLDGLGFQLLTPESRTTYKDFTILIDSERFGVDRDTVATALAAEGVPSRKYFAPPCHEHRAFSRYNQRRLPQTDLAASQCLSIPLLDHDSVEGIAEAFHKLRSHSDEIRAKYQGAEVLRS